MKTLLSLFFVLNIFSSLATVPATVYNVRDYGATGRKQDDATAAIAKAVQAARTAGGGTVQVPPGDYTAYRIVLYDNITLQLDAGSVLYVDLDHPAVVEDDGFIFADNAKNVAIRGRGKIDGQAKYKWADYTGDDVEIEKEVALAKKAGVEIKRSYRVGKSLFMFLLKECSDVLIEDITCENSSIWCMRIWGSNRVTIRGVTILSDLKMGVNSDGIDLVGTSNAHITGCTISTADDAICLKSDVWPGGTKAYPVENVLVDNCILTSSSTALISAIASSGSRTKASASTCRTGPLSATSSIPT